jgi:hypothetical protein
MTAIGVDFDGVIHGYSRGWQDGSIYDPPVPGAFDALRDLMATFAVFIFTARTDLEDVAGWVERGSGIRCVPDDGTIGFWGARDRILVTSRKVAATAYIDDRGIRFESWPQALAAVAACTWPARRSAA